VAPAGTIASENPLRYRRTEYSQAVECASASNDTNSSRFTVHQLIRKSFFPTLNTLLALVCDFLVWPKLIGLSRLREFLVQSGHFAYRLVPTETPRCASSALGQALAQRSVR
jgi:hypothetical protein